MRTQLAAFCAATAFLRAVAATTPNGNDTKISTAQLTTSCAINTVYVPITVTETVTASLGEATLQGAAVDSSSLRTAYDPNHSTSTHTSTHTSVVTLLYASTSQSSDGGDTVKYYYFMTDGTTSWLDGVSPTGLILTTETTTMTTFITAAAEPLITTTEAGLMQPETDTVTPPAYTTTIYSVASTYAEGSDDPDITSTTRITSWSTTTETTTATRTSFTGLGTIGWNSTNTAPYVFSTLSQDPTITTTLVESVFWGSGSLTTRTSTTLITTTLTEQATIQVTYTPTSSAETLTNTGGAATTHADTSDASTSSATLSSTRPFTYLPTSSSGLSSMSEASAPTPSRETGPSVLQTYTSYTNTSSTMANTNHTYTINAQGISSTSNTAASATPTTHHGITATVTGTVQAGPSTANTSTSAAGVPLVNGTTTLYISVSSLSSTLPAATSSMSTTTSSRGDNVTAAQDSTISGALTDTYSGSGPHSFGITVSPNQKTTASMISSRRAQSPSPYVSAVHSTSGSMGASLSAYSSSFLNTTMSKPSTLTSRLSSISLGPSPTPSVCGEHGNFMIDFDDLPTFDPGSNASDITQRPPVTVFRPYRHLTFSNGYVYAPLPIEPYQPVSRPNVGVFLANGTNKLSRNRPGILPGEFGSVDGQDAMSAFWFDAWNAYFGCDVDGPSTCLLVISAYQFSLSTRDEILADTYNTTIEACTDRGTSGGNCDLQQVSFPDTFRNMTGLQVAAYVDGQQRMWFVDNLALAWSDNSCAAGLLRQRSP